MQNPLNSDSETSQELAGIHAVVTGSSSGIGRAIALELAAAGADVLVHARSTSPAAMQVRDAIRALGRKSEIVPADLSRPENQDALVEQSWVLYDDIHVWINNAGADVLTGRGANLSFEEKLEILWRVDVMATMRVARLVGRRMKARGGSPGSRVILNMGWDQAETGMEGDSGEMFSAAKGAVMAFSRSLARSLAPEVRVNCLAPGWIRTAWGHGASPAWQERACRESLLLRWGAPKDVARAARFLASPAAQFINGQIIVINGGFKPGGD